MDDSALQELVAPFLSAAEPVDILLGILTFNDHSSAPRLAQTLVEEAAGLFPDRRLVVVNCDGGSQDNTPHLIREAVRSTVPVWTIQHPLSASWHPPSSESGVPGRESALRLLVHMARTLRVTACVVLDGNLQSQPTHWMRELIQPIVDTQVDCVLPVFRRNRYEGTLTNVLLAPLTSALYGRHVPYHLGGAYAFSGASADNKLTAWPWDEDIAQYGFDGWVTTAAVAESLDIAYAPLGPRHQLPKISSDLSTVVAQAVGCIFHLMERFQLIWEKPATSLRSGSKPIELGHDVGKIRTERLVDGFRQGLRDLLPIWQLALAEDTLERILELGVEARDEFRFPNSLWVQTVYDFALAYHNRLLHREHLLKSLTPLYLGYTASLIMDTRTASAEHVAQEFARLTNLFESMKPYLTERWRWHDA